MVFLKSWSITRNPGIAALSAPRMPPKPFVKAAAFGITSAQRVLAGI